MSQGRSIRPFQPRAPLHLAAARVAASGYIDQLGKSFPTVKYVLQTAPLLRLSAAADDAFAEGLCSGAAVIGETYDHACKFFPRPHLRLLPVGFDLRLCCGTARVLEGSRGTALHCWPLAWNTCWKKPSCAALIVEQLT